MEANQWPRRACVATLLAALTFTLTGCPQTPVVPGDYVVEWSVNPENTGRVDQDANGAMVTLTAVPIEGWEFSEWSGADVVGGSPLVVDAREITSITANFVEIDEPPPGSPTDRDDDGVPDEIDDCPDEGTLGEVGPDGCPEDEPPPDDPTCGNGKLDRGEECDDGNNTDGDGCSATCNLEQDEPICGDGAVDTEAGEECDDGNTTDGDGCSATCTLEQDEPTCGNGVIDAESGEECDDGNRTSGDGCSSGCQTETGGPVCGNGSLETGEDCDDGNNTDGDGCDSNCQVEPEGPPNNSCTSPIQVEDGTRSVSNLDATTDGPDEPTVCDFDLGTTDVQADVWYCYEATCTGELVVSLCGSDYDTKMAVYEGCGCPTAPAVACSDDDCGTGGIDNTQSRITLQATAGQEYMIRVGGYQGEQGDGRLTIYCGEDRCGSGAGDCFVPSPSDEPGCGDPDCCATTCELDHFCCDVSWDSFCSGEAAGMCTDGFPACQVGIGSCAQSRGNEPGCGNVDCCNTVCSVDPFCCINVWDDACVEGANGLCALTCGSRAGDCFTAHLEPGCNDVSCCQTICPDDPFCCTTEWDEECASQADTLCTP